MKTHHNKLVRDRIPEIIKSTGRQCSTCILSDEEYAQELIKKLQEEVTEFSDQPSLEELADILEVVKALSQTLDADLGKVEAIRKEKEIQRGAFREKIFLEWVE